MAEPRDAVSDYWSRPRKDVTPGGTQWTEVVRVQYHLNERASGDREYDWLWDSMVFAEHLPPPRKALSLGCGTGLVERRLRERDICQEIDGLDVAAGALAEARRLAAEEGLDGITYSVADLNDCTLPEEAYDIVYAHASLHHVFRLEHLLDEVKRTLKPRGLFVLYEYIGPSQMQFPREHLQIADAVLRLVPERYRRNIRWERTQLKDQAPRLSLADVLAVDPSEAVRATEIVPIVASRFRVRRLRYLGGTLLLLVLSDIAGNFLTDDAEAERIVEGLIQLDSFLVDSGALPSYHVYMVCEKSDDRLAIQAQAVPLQQHARPQVSGYDAPPDERTPHPLEPKALVTGLRARVEELESYVALVHATRGWRALERYRRARNALPRRG